MKQLLDKFILIKCKHFIYKHNAEQITSSIFTIYYKSFLGIIRVSCYYSSYSQASNAPIKLIHRY